MNVALHPSFIEFCAGAGMLGEGVRGALPDARCVLYVENEVTAAGVLVARIADGALDDAPIWSDARSFDSEPWRGRVGGIIGGYPCQPFSFAGKRQGAEDPRHLWPVLERHIRSIRPQWCFFENVAGHLRLGYHDIVRPDLERLGYRVTEGIFKASEVGAPHSRERLFILAYRNQQHAYGSGDTGQGRRAEPSECCLDVADTNLGSGSTEPRQQHQERTEVTDRPGSVGDSHLPRLEGRQRSVFSRGDELPAWPPGPTDTDAWANVLRVRPDLAPAIEPAIRGVADGMARKLDLTRADQLHILGNGVVPQQATLAFRKLAERLGIDL